MSDPQIKEVSIEVAQTTEFGGGGGGTRRRRRRTRHQQETQDGGAAPAPTNVTVEKAGAPTPVAAAPAVPAQKGGAPPPTVVIAPAKKKIAKVMLVPKAAALAVPGAPTKPVRPVLTKTFKAKRVKLTIDNTARTVKRRRMELSKIDAMSDEQVRDAAVMARLAKRETVAKAPPELLRQMLKDYRTMRGQLL
jgi:hypothetical protein